MSLWNAFVDGLAAGVSAAARIQEPHGSSGTGGRERGRIDRLCRSLGWTVDERNGDTVSLHFDHPELGRRSVRIVGGDDRLVLFAVYSHAFPPADRVPSAVLGYLLGRSGTASVGGWGAEVDADGDVVFRLNYRALGDGLDAATLRFVCESMIPEVIAFDRKMQAAGLL